MTKEAVLQFITHAPTAYRTELITLANACQHTRHLLTSDGQGVHREELFAQRKQLEGFLLGGMLAAGIPVSAGATINGGSIIDVIDQFEHHGYQPPLV